MHDLRAALLAIVLALPPLGARAATDYPPGPDSKPQPGVPQGTVFQFTLAGSAIFPGTRHDCWVYVPAEYQPEHPACVYVGQDGLANSAPVVFDNLIHRHEMPVTIGVFVKPGVVPAADTNAALDRFDRSYEYDGLGDNYARFLLEELLPQVEKITLPDGRLIRLSHAGNDRAIGGQSSGAIAAFTAAWERPGDFSRVFSAIGTYVDLRGGGRYPTLIRKFEPKPLRIFMQDGTNDNNAYGGDWWMANQTMWRALEFSGYEANHVWGEGAHNGQQATQVFPDAMRWLWKDWPQPVRGGSSKNATLAALLIPGQDWQPVSREGAGGRTDFGLAEFPAVNAAGEVFFEDVLNNIIFKVGREGRATEFLADSKKSNGQAFGPDGKLYVHDYEEAQIVTYAPDGAVKVAARGVPGVELVVAHNGNIYLTDSPPATTNAPSQVWLVRPSGEKEVVDTGLKFANGIALSPDQSLLYVANSRSHWVYSYVIQPDGTLLNKQRYFWLHTRDEDDDSGAYGMKVDREGRLYVATAMGIQVCDQAGRVQCILPSPGGRILNLCFGGERFDTLYALCGDRVFKRQLNVVGDPAWAAPHKPAPPRL